MKIFSQLSTEKQQQAIKYCISLIIDDALTGDLTIDSEQGASEIDVSEYISSLVEDSLSLPENKRKDFLLADEIACDIFNELALEMAKSAFYHQDDEFVIFENDMIKEAQRDTDPAPPLINTNLPPGNGGMIN